MERQLPGLQGGRQQELYLDVLLQAAEVTADEADRARLHVQLAEYLTAQLGREVDMRVSEYGEEIGLGSSGSTSVPLVSWKTVRGHSHPLLITHEGQGVLIAGLSNSLEVRDGELQLRIYDEDGFFRSDTTHMWLYNKRAEQLILPRVGAVTIPVNFGGLQKVQTAHGLVEVNLPPPRL